MITYLLIGLGFALGMFVLYVFDTVENDELSARPDVVAMLKESGAGFLVVPLLWPVVLIAVPVVCADEIFAAWRRTEDDPIDENWSSKDELARDLFDIDEEEDPR